LADSFSTAFEEAYSALLRLEQTKLDKNRVPTVQERMQLSHDIYKLDSSELGAMLTIIEENCPSALNRRSGRDEVLINIDGISSICFHNINEFVLECILSKGGKKKKAAAVIEAKDSGKFKKVKSEK
jgi:hypothetical protein